MFRNTNLSIQQLHVIIDIIANIAKSLITTIRSNEVHHVQAYI